MGTGGMRLGAGRPAYRGKTSQCLSIDVRRLAREDLAGRDFSATWQWSNGSVVGMQGQGRDSIRLQYAVGGVDRSQTVSLDYTACALGGDRPWFKCPICSGRCAIVYSRGSRFACRKCQRLSYPCQSEDAVGRIWRAQSKIERKLGDDWCRPTGMHHSTYQRLLDRLADYEEAKNVQFAIAVQSLMRNVHA